MTSDGRMNFQQFNQKLNQRLSVRIPLRWAVIIVFLVALGPRLALINKGFFHHDAILMIDAVQASIA